MSRMSAMAGLPMSFRSWSCLATDSPRCIDVPLRWSSDEYQVVRTRCTTNRRTKEFRHPLLPPEYNIELTGDVKGNLPTQCLGNDARQWDAQGNASIGTWRRAIGHLKVLRESERMRSNTGKCDRGKNTAFEWWCPPSPNTMGSGICYTLKYFNEKNLDLILIYTYLLRQVLVKFAESLQIHNEFSQQRE